MSRPASAGEDRKFRHDRGVDVLLLFTGAGVREVFQVFPDFFNTLLNAVLSVISSAHLPILPVSHLGCSPINSP